MALYQPTNVIPSSYTKGTVDAVNDKMEISWQVNGNSAMTAFQIDFYLNDANSTPVTSTGRRTDNIPTGGFYGTDRFGRPQFFTWNTDSSWAQFSFTAPIQITNGNEYKYKITQWYKGNNNVLSCQISAALSIGKIYYFKNNSAVITFSVSQSLTSGTKVIYYSFTNDGIWVDNGTRIVLCAGSYIESGTAPSDAIEITGDISTTVLDTLFVSQTASNVIITRDKPTLTIYRSDGRYVKEIDFANGGSIATSIGFFKAKYEQLQGNPISWIRWQVATATYNTQTQKWVLGDILQDTGDIYTPTLNYEYNGFFNGQQYAIRALGESESGQECNSNSASEGWIYFTVAIENQGKYDGNFTVQCLNKENATLLEWEGVEIIPPTVSPEGYEPQISNGSVTLNGKNGDTEYSVTWDKVMDKNSKLQNMNFAPDWTAVWKGKVEATPHKAFTGYKESYKINSFPVYLSLNPANNLIAVSDFNSEKIEFYNIAQNGSLSYNKNVSDAVNANIGDVTEHPFVQFGNTNILYTTANYGQLWKVGDNSAELIDNQIFDNIDPDDTYISGAKVACFSKDDKYLVVGDELSPTKIYNLTTKKWTNVLKNGNAVENIKTVSFLDNTTFILGGRFNEYASIYVLNNDGTATWKSDIKKNGTSLDGIVNVAVWLDKTTFLLGGAFSGYASIFTINIDGSTTFKSDLPISSEFELKEVFSIACDTVNKRFMLTSAQRLISSFGLISYSYGNDEVKFIEETYLIGSPTLATPPIIADNYGNMIVGTQGYNFQGQGIYSFVPQYDNTYTYAPNGKVLDLLTNQITINLESNNINVNKNEVVIASFTYPYNATEIAIIINSSKVTAYYYDSENVIDAAEVLLNDTNWQQPITSVSIYGGDSGSTIDSVSIFNNKESIVEIPTLYETPDFEPVWNDKERYTLYMTANFNGNLEGGTGTAIGSGFRIYRQEVGKNVLTPIATVPSTTTSIKDYGIVSRKAYKYSLYAYDNNGAFMSGVENEKVVATCFKNYSLLVCDYDEENDEYHVRKQYLFALNLSVGSVANNNSPTLNANFTRYPTRMPSTQNYASGTLSGLIGAIYTVPALIEQIDNYKYTAKPSTLDYFDNVDLEKELYGLSTAPYQLFLRDMKGRLRMIATNSAITMTTNIKQKQQSISISFPWVEVGDASDVTIIQTPDDYGWNNDNQILDVSLDVDAATGELSATYPFPYNGTKFYLTGVSKETLMAKTPFGVTPAQFDLSETTTETDDGELTATVKVNSEES